MAVAKGYSILVLCVLVGMAGMEPLGAEPSKGEADVVQTLRKAQGMLRQLSQEKTALEAKTVELEKALEEGKKSLELQSKQLEVKLKENQALQNEVKKKSETMAILEKNNEILKSNNEKIKEQLGQQLQAAREQIQESNQQARQLAAELNDNQQDNSLLVHAVKERTDWITKCTNNNRQLIKINRDILDNFQNQDFWDSLKDAEPLTGIASVAKENRIEGYRYKLNDLKVTPWDDAQAAGISGVQENLNPR